MILNTQVTPNWKFHK
ncbi:hypothetical protein BDFB_008272 [Asbolus verrucosus]|uniref:Uncharacterized protein n=1 Tax=Asbolus verrucosus TaxID=1661398 RepID=A0A482VBX0_ASBVE|nr:hypothetical protein BDFB_008272 [Asbolus verrucosus]